MKKNSFFHSGQPLTPSPPPLSGLSTIKELFCGFPEQLEHLLNGQLLN